MSRRNKENAEAEEKKIPITDLKVLRAKEYKNSCFIDLRINGVKIYGCRYVEGKNGDFISFPSHKGKDGEYYNDAWAELSTDDVKNIDEQIDKLLGE